ncbi:MAG TPA: nucleotidyl transferase AbiEii/AbiGii toxin family protein [Candidatus Kapabacteria bacterium]|nr:nucleotidyl transferase AbiEii/AbiGii toxin family protein [Candidatus Kapabacteria bacterium]
MEFFENFLEILKALWQEKVEYVLIGGFAVIIHGMPRVTQDLDIFVKMVPENIDKLRKAFKVVFNDDSIDGITLGDLSDYSVIRYGTPDGFYIDILGRIGEVATYDDLEYETITVEGVQVRIASIETLFWLKKDTLRMEDKRDAFFLNSLIQGKNKK